MSRVIRVDSPSDFAGAIGLTPEPGVLLFLPMRQLARQRVWMLVHLLAGLASSQPELAGLSEVQTYLQNLAQGLPDLGNGA